ncbi:MAG TPA: L-threonylcarbamoyladenylate synthase [Deltaproteobacteria bacterium]|nr:L-threonylcarbamoyladenylate synthase [Deltaproteobacteria bacterium]HPJ92273.1 L-threonylcarbamoyladenylate synthase [Deltaproteobacteria bacterium]HPR51251.1 L-threonylcarbamoyladenylate synthase [Deltaproteobacteria bacterium]
MRILIDPVKPKPRAVKRVAEILSDGGIIVYPTDTVYGLGCSITNKKGIDKINTIKASIKPRSIMFSDIKSISKYAKVSNEAFRLMKTLLPGPYTIVLPATRLVPRLLQSNRKSIGVRIPDHWFCQAIVDEIGEPIITTSVPLSHERLHIDPLEIEADLGHMVDAIVDSGILPDIPSTMISLETDTLQVIREGLGPVDILG